MRFSFGWRGGTREWSNLWHFTQGSWQDQTHFNAFSDAWWNYIKQFTCARVTMVDTTGYDPGSFLPVFTKAYGAAGTYTDTSNPQAAGEMCLLWRFTTDQRTTKNHPIYLYKWFHGTQTDGATAPDTLRNGIKSTADGQITNVLSGASDGTLTRHYCGPFGAVAQSGTTNVHLIAREFPT